MTALVTVKDALRLFQPVRAEEVVLDSYSFLSQHRTGVAAALTAEFSEAAPIRGRVPIRIPVAAANGDRHEGVDVQLEVLGPGDVVNIDRRQIVRRFPQPGTSTAEPNLLAHIEFDAPDLPWQFTPTGHDHEGGLPPWLRLAVLPADSAVIRSGTRPGLPAVVDVPVAELPPAAEGWAWAHVQVQGPPGATPGLADRLSSASPELNLARILCPRQLEPNRDWVALLVPAFEVGRLAGLGHDIPAGATLTYAWGPGRPERILLPVYDHWHFGTGPKGDFESLARRLRPKAPPPGVGRRRLDISRPGNGLPNPPEPTRRDVYGPLVRVSGDELDPGDAWPASTTEALQRQLAAAARHRFGRPEDGAVPTVGPPLYAGAHLARSDTGEPGDPAVWFRDLNLDPAHRVVAALGVRVVQQDQEDLMVSAWAQLAGVEAANAMVRAAQLGRWASASLHRRHLATLSAGDQLAVTARAHSRLLQQPAATVLATLEASALPVAATGPGIRRLARAAGPLTRFTRPGPDDPPGSLTTRAAAVRRLAADVDDRTADWVVPYHNPDGVSTGGLLGVMTAAGPGGQWSIDVGASGEDGRERTLLDFLVALLETLPTPSEILEVDPAAAFTVWPIARQIVAVIQIGGAVPIDRWEVSARTQERFGLSAWPTDDRDPGAHHFVDVAELQALLAEVRAVARDQIAASYPEYIEDRELDPDDRVLELLGPLREAQPPSIAADLDRLSADLPVDGPVEERRGTIAIGELNLPALLDPARTVPRRLWARIASRPDWLPTDWFDDGRIEPIMAAPSFHHPMYEALHRYDPEWLLPGIASMEPAEMTTLLQTNSPFVEAFLVGLNHEFARELLWREYPTDGRATSFRSFWTRREELQAALHTITTGALGSHLDPALDDAIVLLVRGELVRRYPDLLAHAVQQTAIAPEPPRFRDSPEPTFSDDPAETLFRLLLPPDLLLVGFRLAAADVMAPNQPAWWFMLSEHIGEPRFGLDNPPEPPEPALPVPRPRADLAWGDLAHTGMFLQAGDPYVEISDAGDRRDAAGFAELLFQFPARAAFVAADMINEATNG